MSRTGRSFRQYDRPFRAAGIETRIAEWSSAISRRAAARPASQLAKWPQTLTMALFRTLPRRPCHRCGGP